MKNFSPNNLKLTNSVPKTPSSIIYIGKFLQFFCPPLATKYAMKLFRTPIRFKTPIRERMMAKSAQKGLVLIPKLNKSVMVYTYGYSKRKVLLIHGWSGRGTQLYKVADKLLENGFMTISFDAPAHGKSPGKETMMTEFIETSLFLEKKYGPFEIAVGHSLGGMTILNGIKRGLNLNKGITIGSGDDIHDILKSFTTKLQFKPKMNGQMKALFISRFGEKIEDYSGSLAAKNIAIPILVIHDSENVDVDVSCAYNIRQNLNKGELLITKGLGQTRILKDNLVVNRIIEFIKRDI
tara:strand:+ start:42 stop:923 length:882 start_codon:yes stop_codon:yes gene_type:complete